MTLIAPESFRVAPSGRIASLRRFRPTVGEISVCFEVGGDLQICFSSRQPVQLPSPLNPAATFFSDIGLDTSGSVSLIDVLLAAEKWKPNGRFIVQQKKRHAMLSQLFLAVGSEVELRLDADSKQEDGAGGDFTCPAAFDPHSCSCVQLNAMVLKYWSAQQDFTRDEDMSFLSLASDKSRVLGLSLMNTCLVTSSGRGMWCIPAVMGPEIWGGPGARGGDANLPGRSPGGRVQSGNPGTYTGVVDLGDLPYTGVVGFSLEISAIL